MNRHLLENDPIAHVSAQLDTHRAILDRMEETPPRTLSPNPAEAPEVVLDRQRAVVANLERILDQLSKPAS